MPRRFPLIAALALASCARPPLPPWVANAEPTVRSDGPILVLGDTQRTLAAEVLWGREQNERERRALIEQLARDERPAFIAHLGDMVAVGGAGDEWEYFDHLVSPLRARKIPIRPVFGNHDTWGGPRAARRNARRRFPELAYDARAERHRGIGLVWLNSNLEGAAGLRQARWFSRVLEVFDQPGTRGVIVFLHHPAYTNGLGRHPSPYVSEQILPRFLAAHRTVVMMSAHVHGYEHFYDHGRHFVISSGGGGPRVQYAVGADAAATTAFHTPTGAPRPFHYVAIHDEGARLRFDVKCLRSSSGCANGLLEQFWVNLPEAKTP